MTSTLALTGAPPREIATVLGSHPQKSGENCPCSDVCGGGRIRFAIASTFCLVALSFIVSMQRSTRSRPSASATVSRMALREVPSPCRVARTTRGSLSTKRARKSIRPEWSRDVTRARSLLPPTCCHKASTASSRDTTGPIRSGAPSI